VPCQIQSLKDLYDCLYRAVTGTPPNQKLVLSGQLFAEASELVSYLGLGSLELAQRVGDIGDMVQLKPDHVEVKATAVLFPDGPGKLSYDVELSGTYPGKPALALRGTPAATVTNWTFAENFAAKFPDYYGAKDAKLAWLPSFLPEAAFDAPAFRISTQAAPPPTALTFEGKLDLTKGSLQPLKGYFSSDTLQISGPVTVRTGTFPLLDLDADPGYSIPKLADISMELAVRDEKPSSTDLELVGRPTLAGFDEFRISSPLLQSPYAWVFTARSLDPTKYSLKGTLDALSKFAGGPPLTLPSGFESLASMYLESVRVGFAPSKTPKIDLIAFRIASDPKRNTLWSAPILGLKLEDLAVEWDIIGLSGSDPSMLGTMTGTLVVEPARLDASVTLSGLDTSFAPDVQFSLALDPKTKLPVASLFKAFTGLSLEIPLDIIDLRLEGSTGARTLQFVTALEPTWKLPVPASIDEVTFAFLYAPNSFTATLGLRVTLFKLGFIVGAAFRGENKGWLLSGGLLPTSQGTSLDTMLNEIAPDYFPKQLPAGLGKIELRDLSTSFDTSSSQFSFDGAVGWPFELPGLKIDIEAALSLTKEGSKPVAGWVQGALTIDSLRLAAKYSFGVKGNETIAFELGWRGAKLTCIFAHNAKGESTLRANLGGVSFGDIVAWLAGLGGEQVTLSAPWDALYRIRFDDLWLDVNLDTKEVGVTYDIGLLNLGVAKIESIGLSYARRAGSPSLDIKIAGSFVGVDYPADDPLSWDMLKDPPPAPPGKAEALLDLRYLGLGQNVGFRETKAFHRVADVITALESDFKPIDDKDNPLAILTTLKFTGTGNWLIGADFTVMSAVSIAGVFADPSLYGIRIGLSGERVKKLAGLEFEILYRKITDTVGVYHIELTLPEAMRQIDIPPVSVTVPTIVVDVYTNGNFRLDFGFPANRDWQRSFCIQGGPFIGYGGFYFALLDGSTSEKVPAISNGTFSPVIEFGLGLQMGLGRTIDKGVLKAGATITVEGIVEGVLGWFNPTERSGATDVYYWIQGTVGVIGKVYGEVNFVVVKARVSITAKASVTLTVEAYKPAAVRLLASVEVSASIEVLFFTITFSFSASLDLSFTIGEASTPPWRVTAAPNREHPLQLLSQRSSHRIEAPDAVTLVRAASPAGPRAAMDWTPRRVLDAETVPDVDVMVVPVLTPALGQASDPVVQIVMSLLVPTSTPARAQHADQVRQVEHENAAEVAFNVLAGGVLRWAIGALGDRLEEDSVTAEELDAIACFLADRKNRDATFTYERVTGLIEQNFRLRISNPLGPTGGMFDAGSDTPRSSGDPPVQGAVLPMIPEISMTPQGLSPINFWSHHCAGEDYRTHLETYYDQLRIDPESGVPSDPFAPDPCANGPVGLASANGAPRSSPPPGGCDPGLQAVSSIVFCDWFALVAQQSVQLAADLMKAYAYRPTGTETLRDIIEAFDGIKLAYRTRPGDTPGTVAATFGVAPAELHRTSPWLMHVGGEELLPTGSTVHVEVRPTVRTLAKANPDYPLRKGSTLTIRKIRYQSRTGDTLGSIGKAFGIADLGALFVSGDVSGNASSPELLRPGATIAIPSATRVVGAADLGPADALDRIVASYFARARQRPMTDPVREQVAWYAAALGLLNPNFSGSVKVPIAELDPATGRIVDTGQTTSYTVKEGDTVAGVAAAFALLQLDPTNTAYAEFRANVTVQPPPPLREGSVVRMTACTMPVHAGDTFASIAGALLISGPSDLDPLLGALEALARANGTTNILAARAVLALPTVKLPLEGGETLSNVAQRFAVTLEELADSIQDDPGILMPYDGKTSLTVPDVATRRIDQLVADMVALGEFNSLSATASRFTLSGMRAPVPGPTGAPEGGLRGLYEVVGQQFPAPAATGATYHVGFENATGATWFCFEPPPGQRAGGNCLDKLDVALTPGFFRGNFPATTLDPLTVTGPVPMQLYDLVPPSHAIEHAIPWQSATPVSLPGPTGPSGPVSGVAATPSLWMFPQSLLSRLGASGPTGPTAVTEPFELLSTPVGVGPGATARPLERYSWATAIPLTVRRAVDDSGVLVPGTYEIIAVGESSRELLLEAWMAATAAPAPGDRLYLLHPVGVAGPNDQGLVSDVLSANDTFLLRTNLSTVTHSGRLAGAAPITSDYFARISAIGPFLNQVWEATITASGGFHMTYANSAGQGLPDELFASDGTTQLVALLLLDRQSRRTAPERGLLRFNNCAVVGEGLDAAATSVAVRPSKPPVEEMRRTANVPPGVVGFGLARRNPGPTGAGPTGTTRRLHSLVGYELASDESKYFGESNESLPLSPVDDVPAWMDLPAGPTHAYWTYHQAVPIAQFGLYNKCPRSAALPPADHNPYAGITGPTAGTGELSFAKLDLAYHDVYGNTTTATKPAGAVNLPVGYTDELIAVAAWPGAAMTYLFHAGQDGGGPVLTTTISLQADRYLSGAGSSYETAIRTANADAERYRALFYQTQQLDVGFALGSNIGVPAGSRSDLRAAMTAFVTKAKVFADSTRQLRQHTVKTAAEPLGALAERLALTPQMLLEGNLDADAAALFPATYVKPRIVAAPAMNTLTNLAGQVKGRSGVPASQRSCAGVEHPDATCSAHGPMLRLLGPGEALTSGPAAHVDATATDKDVAIDNASQPLNPGNVLRTEQRTSDPLPAERRSLQAAAQWLGCSVFAEVVNPEAPKGAPIQVGLFIDNWDVPGLIADGMKFVVEGIEVDTKDDTFKRILGRISPPGHQPPITVAALANAVADVPELLIAGRTLRYATLVVPQPPAPTGPAPAQPAFSLAQIPASAGTIERLADLNRAVATFFFAGAPLLLGFSCCKAQQGDTPRSLAHDAAITISQLAQFNAPTTLGAGVELTVPDVTFLPDPASCWAALAPAPDASLTTIAAAVGAPPAAIADVNRELPGIFRSEAVVTVGSTRITANAEDSLESVHTHSGASWDAFVAALQQPVNAGIYRASGAIMTPLPSVPGTGTGTPALEALAAQLGADAASLLTANRTQQGFLRGGASIFGPPPPDHPGPPPAVQVGEYDTVLSIQRKLRAQGSDATVEKLVDANRGRTGLLTGGAAILLAPAPTAVSGSFTPTIPPPGSEAEQKILFPVEVWIEMTRARGLVHPDFRATDPVQRAQSQLAPRIASRTDRQLALREFASQFELAFNAQPLKCAVSAAQATGSQSASRRSTPGTNSASSTRVWAVNFGVEGISRFAVDASRPAFYALRPLSTTPWSGTVSYPSYVSGKGLCAEVMRRIQGVDVDAWMRELLATIDLALTPGYAVPAFRMVAARGARAPAALPREPLRALSAPEPEPEPPDPLSGPIGLISAAKLSRPALGSLAPGATGCTGPTASGPADYNLLTQAKENIAQALSGNVQPIVAAPGATGPYQVDWAQEALRQQMLARLSDGYNVSAVVQLPCEVDSPMVTPPPGTTGTAPPRASGKVMPRLRQVKEPTPSVVPPPTSLAGLAGQYGVSVAFLAQVIGDVDGLLRSNAVIAGVTVGPHGTINRVAQAAGIPTDPTVPGYWETWPAFVAGFADKDVLQVGAEVPLSSAQRAVSAGESLSAIGEFFARDVTSVGRANQEQRGIVRPGEIRIDGYPQPYTTTANDNLVDVANGISDRNPGLPPLTVSKLFLMVAERPTFLEPGKVLHMVETLPGMSLSTSKVSLGPVGQGAVPPPLTFLVTVKQEAEQARLLLDLEYVINELEYAIRNVPGAGTYQASSWLTFVLPLDGSKGGVDVRAQTRISQIQIPIPLRAYPPPSVLSGQSGIASHPGSDQPARAREWDYRYDVLTQKAAQDTDHLQVLFGERGLALQATVVGADLMKWLAAYVEAAPGLRDDLARLPQVKAGAYDAIAAYAYQSLAIIADRVGHALLGRVSLAAAGATAAQTYAYQMTTLTNGPDLGSLTLTPELPGPVGPSALWPRVYVQSPTAPTGGTGPDAGFIELPGTAGVYQFERGFAANRPHTYRFRFDGRDVIRNRTGRGSIRVTRNERLIPRGPLGPTGSTAPVPTCEGFIYRTPAVQFVDPLVPLIDADATIDVANLGTGQLPRALADHIKNMLRAATDVTGGGLAESANIELAISYGFLASADLLVRTPIILIPWQPLGGANVDAFATQLARSVENWHATTQVDETTGLLALELSVFATGAASGSGGGRRPILRFTDFRLAMKDILWPI
jgi:hypothetical protein